MDDSLVSCLLEAPNSSAALHALFHATKRRHKSFSLAQMSRKAGIPSRGYASDIVAGRRIAHLKYEETLPVAFGLDGAAADYLRCLLRRDHATDADETRAIERRMAELRKVLSLDRRALPSSYKNRQFFAFEVFCAFSLFKNRPTRDDLAGHFGRARAIDVDHVLHDLVSLGLVRREAERYELLKDFVLFDGSEDGLTHIEFLSLCLQQALARLEHWFPRRDEALIRSSVIAVRRDDYRRRLPEIRALIDGLSTELEASDADMLVRLNVQIFPND